MKKQKKTIFHSRKNKLIILNPKGLKDYFNLFEIKIEKKNFLFLFKFKMCDHTQVIEKEGEGVICQNCGDCMHKNMDQIDGNVYCADCGEEINELSYEKDWRYYGTNDSKGCKDPSRCHQRKVSSKNLFAYTEGKPFEQCIVTNANEKYIKIKDETRRGKNNKAVITACIYSAYLDEKEPKTIIEIGKIFGINKKNIAHGLETFYQYFPEYRTLYIVPSVLLRRLMVKLGIDIKHYKKIRKICLYVENSDTVINRSTPQSVCCSLVYLYLCIYPHLKEEYNLPKNVFIEKVGMSEITITKICKEAVKLLDLDDVKL